MTPRIVMTSGDPSLGVITIEAAPDGLSLPATVEVTKACDSAYPDGSCDCWRHSGLTPNAVVVLGTATLEAVWEWETVERIGASTATLAAINFGPLLRQDGCAWIARNLYDALTPGVVAYLTDWNPT